MGLIVVLAGMFYFSCPRKGFNVSGFPVDVYFCLLYSQHRHLDLFFRSQPAAGYAWYIDILFPAMLMSGIMFPIENMPFLIKLVAYCDPLKYSPVCSEI